MTTNKQEKTATNQSVGNYGPNDDVSRDPAVDAELFKAIDALDLSPTSGFAIFADDIEMVFGDKVMKGSAAAKQFFVTFDTPFKTVHNVTGVWQVGNAFVMQGSADMLKTGFAPETTFHLAPLFNVIWLDAGGKIARYVVTFPPGAEQATAKQWPGKQ